MKIATSRYHAADLIDASGLVPVGITVGAARFLRYELAGNIGPLAPYGVRESDGTPLRKIDDDAEFEIEYRKRLEMFGVDAIRELLEAFAHAYVGPTDGLVLLCFENVLEGESCHRRMFARWWEEQTGEEVPELAPAQTDLVSATSGFAGAVHVVG